MLEDNLRTLFTVEVAADQPPSHISVPVAGRSARVRQRMWRAFTIGSPLLAAAAVIAVIATSVALTGGGERIARPAGPGTSLAVPGAAGWTRLPRAPIAPRSEYAAIWTGKKMIVWGGYSGNTQYGDGAAYDPATERRSMLPAAPLRRAARDSMLAVWTGRYLVVGGGDGSTGLQKDAAAYDPATNSWTRLPDAPVGFEGNGTAPDIWTGASVITIEGAVPGGRPLSLDLTTRGWSLGPKAPVPRRQEAHEIWTWPEVLIWGGGVPVGNSCFKTVKTGYNYTP